MGKTLSLCAVILGAACIITAGVLLWDNQQEEQVAQRASQDIVAVFKDSAQVEPLDSHPTPDPVAKTTAVEAVEIDGTLYLGVLTIPALGLELAVCNSCDDEALKKTPCVYAGNLDDNNLIIAAHNYQAHFGTLHQLALGAEITILDAAGVAHGYVLVALETVDEQSVAELSAGEWDLSLFTCVYGNNTKRTVARFEALDCPNLS